MMLSSSKPILCALEQRGNIFILTFIGDGDHRLSPSLTATLLSTLRQIKSKATRGSVLITTSQGKFYSNGFDLAWAKSVGAEAMECLHEMVEAFRSVTVETMSLPIPTIAAIQGHGADVEFLFALSHDYLLMRSNRGVLYMSEIDLGLPLLDYCSALLRLKLHGVPVRRDVVLRGSKVRGEEAVEMEIADAAYNSGESLVESTMSLTAELASRKWDGENY